jgi:glycosyltransferase involved in cell wall biosynthesis
VIDHYVPHHDKDAGGRSTWMYLRQLLAAGCRVQFMGANFFPHEPYTTALEDMGIEVLVGESIARNLDRWLAEHAPYIDEIFLHRPHVAEQFLPHLERMQPRPPISFFGHDLHYLRFEREAAVKDDETLREEAERWRRRELAVCRRVDRIYYFSDVEIAELATQLPSAHLHRVPLYAMEIGPMPEYAPLEPHSLLFVGGFNHPPNVDAATWLVEAILPPLRERVPDVHLHLVGSNPTPEVLALAGDGVTVHGYVADEVLAELYRRVGTAVVPLQYGAGVKGKVIEAVSHHVPLVTTDIGAEGIPEADRVMWIENTAEDLAARLAAILAGEESVAEKLEGHAAWLARHFDATLALDTLRADMPALARFDERAA